MIEDAAPSTQAHDDLKVTNIKATHCLEDEILAKDEHERAALPIRWLHISDVHESEAEGYHREAMYEAIVAEVERRPKPDLVFFTGDLAFKGSTEEYELLERRFLEPLRAALPGDCPIFTVPGNHDVDRRRGSKPRVWIKDAGDRRLFQEVGPGGQQKRADLLLLRFDAYREIKHKFAAWEADWLASEQGSVCKVVEIRGHRLAVVGINTAWLCQDDEDWGHLTAGRTMVDAALRQARQSEPDLTVVLGHHPLAAMTGETEWSDGERIRTRLERANALYLHGHLHRSGGQRAGDAMQSVLAIQAPSGFDAPEDPARRNGLMWAEADLDAGRLVVEPKRWNDDFAEYVFDTDAARPGLRVPARDAFWFPQPGREPDDWHGLPAGWEIVDAADLSMRTAERPPLEQMNDWFDGGLPRWEVAAADGVRPRKIVENLVTSLQAAHHDAPQPQVFLLTGAGGEGKSAALLQVAAGLVRSGNAWGCLWRRAANADVPSDLFTKLEERQGRAWIVAIDDAENVGWKLPDALRSLKARTDVHLILAAREADWALRGLKDRIWQGIASFQKMPLAGVDDEDATRIAESWAAYGDAAMGRLGGLPVEQVAKSLAGHARDEAARQEEGSLLGALLIARGSEGLRTRINRFMANWGEAEGIGNAKLLDIYAMIAAMHAENQLYLSRAVLAYALGCDEEDLERGPLHVLRREAMVGGGTTYILTRHRRIAETARDWLVESGYNIDRLYPFLAVAAVRQSIAARFGPDVARWQYELPRHFVERGGDKSRIGVTIAKALFEFDENDPSLLTNFAGTLRRAGLAGAALTLLREHGPRFPGHRGILYEWSVGAGEAGDHGLAVWLIARSLADHRVPLDAQQCKLSLAGLGAAFRELAASTGRADFAAAQAACGRLGLRVRDLDAATRGYFERYAQAAKPPAGAAPTIEAEFALLREAVVQASYEAEPDNDPEFFAGLILEPDSYRYDMLARELAGNPKRPKRR